MLLKAFARSFRVKTRGIRFTASSATSRRLITRHTVNLQKRSGPIGRRPLTMRRLPQQQCTVCPYRLRVTWPISAPGGGKLSGLGGSSPPAAQASGDGDVNSASFFKRLLCKVRLYHAMRQRPRLRHARTPAAGTMVAEQAPGALLCRLGRAGTSQCRPHQNRSQSWHHLAIVCIFGPYCHPSFHQVGAVIDRSSLGPSASGSAPSWTLGPALAELLAVFCQARSRLRKCIKRRGAARVPNFAVGAISIAGKRRGHGARGLICRRCQPQSIAFRSVPSATPHALYGIHHQVPTLPAGLQLSPSAWPRAASRSLQAAVVGLVPGNR